MNVLDIYFITHRKEKFLVYLVLYLIIFLVGVFSLKNAIEESLLYKEVTEETIIGTSIGLSLITISIGFLFFLGYDFLERKIFNIIGLFIMIILTVAHFSFNCLTGIFRLETFLLGCPKGYGWSFGLASASHLYVLFVRRIYRITIENYVGEGKKMLIQILLPFACFLIMAFFVSFSLGILTLFLVGFMFIGTGSNKKKMRMAKITKKQASREEMRNAAFGNEEEI